MRSQIGTAERIFNGGERSPENANGHPQMKGELDGDMRIERICRGNFGHIFAGIIADGDSGEAPAHSHGKLIVQGSIDFDIAHGDFASALQFFFEFVFPDSASIEEGSHKRKAAQDRMKERRLDVFGHDETCGDQAGTELNRHGERLYQMRAENVKGSCRHFRVGN